MYKEEGYAGFMRGNGINCARVSLGRAWNDMDYT